MPKKGKTTSATVTKTTAAATTTPGDDTIATTTTAIATAPISEKMSRRLDRIRDVLNHYYPNPPIPLNHTNGFTFLVAVVLSAQTTDGKVNEVTKTLFQYADNPMAMSKLTPSFVEEIIKPVGLAPGKSKNIVALSQMICDRFHGEVPNTFDDLKSLPGVGHKTASVIMSQLFGVSAFAVDTHVHRLALRWGLTKEERNPDKVQADLCRLFPQSSWDKLHLQMIYFGREYCPAKTHQSSDCPICSWVNKDETKYSVETISSPDHLKTFSPTKRAKGLVYYSDRVDEIKGDPTLTSCSPFHSRTTTIVKSENDENDIKTSLFQEFAMNEEKDEENMKVPIKVEIKEEKKIGKRQKKQIVTKEVIESKVEVKLKQEVVAVSEPMTPPISRGRKRTVKEIIVEDIKNEESNDSGVRRSSRFFNKSK